MRSQFDIQVKLQMFDGFDTTSIFRLLLDFQMDCHTSDPRKHCTVALSFLHAGMHWSSPQCTQMSVQLKSSRLIKYNDIVLHV